MKPVDVNYYYSTIPIDSSTNKVNMKPIDVDYGTIRINSSTSIVTYVFNEDMGVYRQINPCTQNWPYEKLSDGRLAMAGTSFSEGIEGLVSRLFGRQPKPKLHLETKRAYKLRSEVDSKILEEIKGLLTRRCIECNIPTRYAAYFWYGLKSSTRYACLDHINNVIEKGERAAFDTVYESESPLLPATKHLGKVKYDSQAQKFVPINT